MWLRRLVKLDSRGRFWKESGHPERVGARAKMSAELGDEEYRLQDVEGDFLKPAQLLR